MDYIYIYIYIYVYIYEKQRKGGTVYSQPNKGNRGICRQQYFGQFAFLEECAYVAKHSDFLRVRIIIVITIIIIRVKRIPTMNYTVTA